MTDLSSISLNGHPNLSETERQNIVTIWMTSSYITAEVRDIKVSLEYYTDLINSPMTVDQPALSEDNWYKKPVKIERILKDPIEYEEYHPTLLKFHTGWGGKMQVNFLTDIEGEKYYTDFTLGHDIMTPKCPAYTYRG